MSEAKKAGTKPDLATIAGVVVALGGILGGLKLEGGLIGDIMQSTAALIVVGGTLGAVLVGTPLSIVLRAIKGVKVVVLEKTQPAGALVEEIMGYAVHARKNGLVSLEQQADQISDPFLRKALTLAIDGTDIQEIRKLMELEIQLMEHHSEAEAKVFETAGGYSPTVGIIGAVLGLIQVMKKLANVEEVGHGIAVAFVATVYGVGLANLVLLPAAAKIKSRAQHQIHMKEMILEGVVGIVEGLNPKMIRSKLEPYAGVSEAAPNAKTAEKAGSARTSPAPVEA